MRSCTSSSRPSQTISWHAGSRRAIRSRPRLPPRRSRPERGGRASRSSSATRRGVAVDGDRVTGVHLGSGRVVKADKVLVAAGPWTPSVVPGWSEQPPIRSVWGVVVTVALDRSPRAVLEELGIDRPGPQPDELFSLVTAGSDTSVGSTFLARQPDPQDRVAAIVERAARYVPALGAARPLRVRACARPVVIRRPAADRCRTRP